MKTDKTDVLDVMHRVAWVLFDSEKALTAREIAQKCRAFRRLSLKERKRLMDMMVKDRYCTVDKTPRRIGYLARRIR